MPYRVIQVGTGGFGASWCEKFLPPNEADRLIDVVAAVDKNPLALENARRFLGLGEHQCFTTLAQACDNLAADFVCVVVPANQHEEVIRVALEHDLHILCEKPIADTLAGCVRVASAVRRAGKKMAVTMSHRYDQDKQTLKQLVRSGLYGPLDYLVCRFTCDCRQFGSWGAARHQMTDPLLAEAAIHHFDLLADLAAAPAESVYCETWTPRWGEYAGGAQALATVRFANGTRATYEGAKCNASGLNGWKHEYIRAECRDATIVLDARRMVLFPYEPSRAWRERMVPPPSRPVPLLERPKWTHSWLIEQFVEWLAGGAPLETAVEENLTSCALMFAALESTRRGQPVNVSEFLQQTRSSEESQ